MIHIDYVNIDVDKKLKDMCTFEEGIAYTRKHINFNEGKQEGIIVASANNVLSCMKAFNVTLEQAIK